MSRSGGPYFDFISRSAKDSLLEKYVFVCACVLLSLPLCLFAHRRKHTEEGCAVVRRWFAVAAASNKRSIDTALIAGDWVQRGRLGPKSDHHFAYPVLRRCELSSSIARPACWNEAQLFLFYPVAYRHSASPRIFRPPVTFKSCAF